MRRYGSLININSFALVSCSCHVTTVSVMTNKLESSHSVTSWNFVAHFDFLLICCLAWLPAHLLLICCSYAAHMLLICCLSLLFCSFSAYLDFLLICCSYAAHLLILQYMKIKMSKKWAENSKKAADEQKICIN